MIIFEQLQELARRHATDLHTARALEHYGVPKDQVSRDMRNHAKAMNFLILYGSPHTFQIDGDKK